MTTQPLTILVTGGSGLLVHISSGLVRFVLPFNGLYSATKCAVEAVAETHRYELATVGIDAVIVEPCVYATRLVEKAAAAGPADAGRASEYLELTRLSREMQARRPSAGDPHEIAHAVADLIELPAGSRPLRTTVGWGAQRADGLDSEELQRSVLEGLGLREQLTLAGDQLTTMEV